MPANWRPGIDYHEFVVLGMEAPTANQFDLFCKHCWPDEDPPVDPGSSSGEATSSSSNSSEEAVGEARPPNGGSGSV